MNISIQTLQISHTSTVIISIYTLQTLLTLHKVPYRIQLYLHCKHTHADPSDITDTFGMVKGAITIRIRTYLCYIPCVYFLIEIKSARVTCFLPFFWYSSLVEKSYSRALFLTFSCLVMTFYGNILGFYQELNLIFHGLKTRVFLFLTGYIFEKKPNNRVIIILMLQNSKHICNKRCF